MNRSASSRRAWWLLLLALLAVSTPAAGFLFTYSSRAALDKPQTGTHNPQAEEGIVCFGQVDLIHGVTALYPLQTGRVKEVLAEEGQSVSEGTVLVRLEDGPTQSRLAEAQAALEEAELRLSQAKKSPEQQVSRLAQQQDAIAAMRSRLSAARRQFARLQKLTDAKYENKDDLAASEEHVHELEAMLRGEEKRLEDLKRQDPGDDIRRAEKEVAIMKARRDEARFAVEECALKAPRGGTILRLLVGPGDVFSGQSRQPAVQFAVDGPQIVRADVEQEFVGHITVGQTARVEDETNPSRVWKGHVERIASWITRRRSVLQEPLEFNDVRTVETVIKLEPKQPPLRIGQRVRVRIGPEEVLNTNW